MAYTLHGEEKTMAEITVGDEIMMADDIVPKSFGSLEAVLENYLETVFKYEKIDKSL